MERDMDYQLDKSYIDIQALIKADKNDPTILYIEASNQLDDSQKDVVLQKALRDEAKSFLRKGVVSWNHLHKVENDPAYIVGEPLDVRFPDDGRTLVKAKMYPSNKYAKSVLAMAKDGSSRLGASIGGFILQRKQELNKSLILKVMWDEVAITHQPINEDTLGKVGIIPFDEFHKSFMELDDTQRAEELQKALSAGYGTDSASFTGGRALQQESLMGGPGKRKPRKSPSMDELNQGFRNVLRNLTAGRIKRYQDMVVVLPQHLKSYAPVMAKYISTNKDKIRTILLQGGSQK